MGQFTRDGWGDAPRTGAAHGPARDWPCPVCGGESGRLFEVRDYWVRSCPDCEHRFVEFVPGPSHARTVYDDGYFFGGGAGYPDYFAESELLIDRGKRYAEIVARYAEPGRLLDVGSAAGFICAGFKMGGWDVEGIEPNPRMVQAAIARLVAPFHIGTLETFRPEKPFDLVTMIQVIAHFFDLSRAMEQAAAATRPGGLLLVETWDHRSLSAKVFGKTWHEYNPPSVLNIFSRASLNRLANSFGFAEIATGRLVKWIAWSHARTLLKHQLGNGVMSRALDLVPGGLRLPYPSEDLFWALFRKQPA